MADKKVRVRAVPFYSSDDGGIRRTAKELEDMMVEYGDDDFVMSSVHPVMGQGYVIIGQKLPEVLQREEVRSEKPDGGADLHPDNVHLLRVWSMERHDKIEHPEAAPEDMMCLVLDKALSGVSLEHVRELKSNALDYAKTHEDECPHEGECTHGKNLEVFCAALERIVRDRTQ